MDNMHCRFCGQELKHEMLDLGFSPLANEYLREEDLSRGQVFYPLRLRVCDSCYLVQAEMYERPDNIFRDYRYFSSYSESWLRHCKAYVDMITDRLALTSDSRVLEVACNDGYLLQYFVPQQIPVLGIEPAEQAAEAARERGIPVLTRFFNTESARELREERGNFDLVIGNNVLAHVPDIRDFVTGLALVLSPGGTITMEFPHLLQLLLCRQFDTIYHEHFHYLSLLCVLGIFRACGLDLYDVEQLSTHGGSLRIYAAHATHAPSLRTGRVEALLVEEEAFGIKDMTAYAGFAERVRRIKLDTLELLVRLKREGKRIAAFGAAAKGNTFLNYCGIGRDMIDYVVDSNPQKQGFYLPGSRIPIVSMDTLQNCHPDYLLILPWNLTEEIVSITDFFSAAGGRYITCIPELRVWGQNSAA